MSKNVLMVIGHPDWQHSAANKAIADAFAQTMPEAVISNLGVLYPDFNIDVTAEQRKLLQADIIILQFPFMWYGAPSIMHRWMEDVLSYGFAFGQGGNKLAGKHIILSFTTGTPTPAYEFGALQTFPVDFFLPPYVALANRCGMHYSGQTYTTGINTMAALTDPNVMEQVREQARKQAHKLDTMIKELTL